MRRQTGWAEALFSKSVLKQQKWNAISSVLGPTARRQCLDIGSDNGVISLLLRRRGGTWASADVDPQAVESIRALVGSRVSRLEGETLPFADDAFDRVVVVDLLEHVVNDARVVEELFRVLRAGGELIVNMPHRKDSWLRRFRERIGQTDAAHGNVRPGYTMTELTALLGTRFTVMQARTYSKFFSQAIDTGMTWAYGHLRQAGHTVSGKGMLVTDADLTRHRRAFRLYSAVYPLVWAVSQLDRLLVWRSGYVLVARVRTNKAAAVTRNDVVAAGRGQHDAG